MQLQVFVVRVRIPQKKIDANTLTCTTACTALTNVVTGSTNTCDGADTAGSRRATVCLGNAFAGCATFSTCGAAGSASVCASCMTGYTATVANNVITACT